MATTSSDRRRSWAGLRHADEPTLKRVREYERKFHRREVVLRALADVRHDGLAARVDDAQRL